jgi:hypothetical protein
MSDYKLTDAQKAVLRESMNSPISEKELCEKLGMDVKTFSRFMKDEKRMSVFQQALSEDELEAASGGKLACDILMRFALCGLNGSPDEQDPCINTYHRGIYDSGFPNCAATVDDGSWCEVNDACYNVSVVYKDMRDCHKAWK